MKNHWTQTRIVTLYKVLAAVFATALLGGTVRGDDWLRPRTFLADNCFDCHTGDSPEAGLDLEELATDLSDRPTLDRWVAIHDRVAAGEMPPADYARLEAEPKKSFLAETAERLRAEQKQQRMENGRVPPRRLTNLQLERTLHQVLGIDIPLAVQMPEEPRTGEYTTLAEKQSLSHYQLAEHLKIVDLALDEAFRRGLTPSDTWSRELTAENISRTRTRTREPELIDGEAVVWSGRLSFYGRIPAITAKEDGWYRVTFPARSLKHAGPGGVWCTVRSGKCVSSAAQLTWVGSFEVFPEQREFTFDAWLPAGHMLEIRPDDPRLKQARFAGGQAANGEGGGQDVPGLAIANLRLERFHPGPNDEQIRQKLFGDLPIQPHSRPEKAQLVVDNCRTVGAALLHSFAECAFRRPVAADQLLPYLEIFHSALKTEHDFVPALRAGYRAVLCSARFMFFYEPPGALDDHAIASRLSYLLWNSPPDNDLLQLANAGRLHDPSVVAEQVERMLRAPAGRQFVIDFAAQWLELQDIGFTDPDPKLHPTFNLVVQHAMLDETHMFLQYLLDNDRSSSELIDSNVTFLNSRLASYYGIENVQGDVLQAVELQDDSVRGGLLAQGAVLKVTANGSHTSPVIRGVWISERLLGCPIPPPPEGIPAIEPDIRGAKTIREQLLKHREDSACAACHTKIDPPGFALENFDAAGAWRKHYPRSGSGSKSSLLPVDASYVLADGTPFSSFQEFRELQARRPAALARNFATQLLTYGTGAKPDFADRQELDRIVASVAQQNYGLRSLVKAVATSSLFLNN